MYYVATLDPHDDGSGRYDVTFADLPGCVTQGTDLEDALRMAQEAVSLHVAGMIADGEPMARSSPNLPPWLPARRMMNRKHGKKAMPCLKVRCGSMSLSNRR